MSTHDVPGANPKNKDVLALGCWAEHDDGSLVYVHSTEGGRVIFEMMDVADKDNPVSWREAMPIGDFNKTFSWDDKKFVDDSTGRRIPKEKWLWHDKTPFPWDRVIDDKTFAKGQVPMSVHHTISAAQRVAEALKARKERIDVEALRSKVLSGSSVVSTIRDKFNRAFNELRK